MFELIVFSRACPRLPLVFILLMSSPVPNYLNLTYRPSTLSLLRLRTVIAPSGIHVLQKIWLKASIQYSTAHVYADWS